MTMTREDLVKLGTAIGKAVADAILERMESLQELQERNCDLLHNLATRIELLEQRNLDPSDN
jgi:hypothetical protein